MKTMSMRSAQVSVNLEPVAVERTDGTAREDWAGVVEQMLTGDRAAQLRLARLVTGFLAHWGAYDFRAEWPDLVQDVLLAVIRAAREGRVRNAQAVVGYVRSIAHHKLMDRLRAHVRRAEDETAAPEGDGAPLGRVQACAADQDVVAGVRRALERLPERKRRVVFAVYGEGKTYDQVAEETGIPLGSVKRYLREGMAILRRDFAVELEAE
jgi:RNA polymerase sigma-70 factor (ECF subfamily)